MDRTANSPRLLSPLELSLRATDNVQLLDSPAQGDPDKKTINKNINTEKTLLMYKTNIQVLRPRTVTSKPNPKHPLLSPPLYLGISHSNSFVPFMQFLIHLYSFIHIALLE